MLKRGLNYDIYKALNNERNLLMSFIIAYNSLLSAVVFGTASNVLVKFVFIIIGVVLVNLLGKN